MYDMCRGWYSLTGLYLQYSYDQVIKTSMGSGAKKQVQEIGQQWSSYENIGPQLTNQNEVYQRPV